MDAREEAPLAVFLFGTPRFRYGDAPVRPAFAKSTLAVLAYVLLNRSAELRRDDVAFALWPDDAESEARANLRRHLYIVTRALPRGPQPWILADARTVAWNPAARLDLDVELFERYAAESATRARALALYEGDLLADVSADWLDARRTHYRERFCTVALDAARDAAESGDHARAVAFAQNVLASDPWREEAIRIVIGSRARGGDRASALAAYVDFERRLRDELDAQPMPQTRELYDAIVGGVSPLVVPDPARPVAPRARSVPGHLSRFIGREAEVRSVASALESCRLVTLLGAGGVGKSRLAAHVAETPSVRATFPGEPIFIELAAVPSDRTALETKIRDALEIESSDEPIVEACARIVDSQKSLVIFDNAEHLIEIAGRFLVELFARSASLTALTTSRAPFHIDGEQIVGLRPLHVPASDVSLEDALDSEAVALFVDRAKSLDANFRLAPEDAPHLVAIVRRLDGIPLALELAAARSNVLSLKEIDERLSDRFTLLTTRRVDTLRHHQTLRATLDWSYDLLAERERRAFRRLAAFKNGWTLEAATEVVRLDGADDIDALDALTRLIDQSLVGVHEVAGARRYEFLDTIHAYALLRLAESGEEDAARRAAATYFERYVGAQHARFGTASEKAAFDRVALEHDNILATLDEAIGRDDARPAVRLCTWLSPFWVTRGFAREAGRRVETLLDGEAELEPTGRRELANVASVLHFRCGDIARSLARARAALGRDPATVSDRISADALVGQARCWFNENETASVATALRRALRIYETLGDRLHVALVLDFLGLIDGTGGAIDFYERSLRIYEEIGDVQGVATVTYHLGHHAYARGDHARSIVYATRACEIWRDIGNLQGENWTQYNIACAEAALGLRDAATARFLAFLKTALRYGFEKDLCEGLERIAALLADDAPDLGARAMGYASRLRERHGHAVLANERATYEADVARVETILGPDAFRHAWTSGAEAVGDELVGAIASTIRQRFTDAYRLRSSL